MMGGGIDVALEIDAALKLDDELPKRCCSYFYIYIIKKIIILFLSIMYAYNYSTMNNIKDTLNSQT